MRYEKVYLAHKLVRPILPITGGIAAWIIAQACGADHASAIAAAISIALSTVGASFYHYGGANWMYARKSDRLKFEDPELVRFVGLAIFAASIGVAVLWLPKAAACIALFNTLAIAAYSARLSSHWLTKNVTMSIVSSTPILLGWSAGMSTHPIVPWAVGVAAIAHFAREIIKDVKDIIANEGKRVTLPMHIGISRALEIAGGLLLVAATLLFFLLRFTQDMTEAGLIAAAIAVFLGTAGVLLFSKKAWRCETAIHASLCLILLAFL